MHLSNQSFAFKGVPFDFGKTTFIRFITALAIIHLQSSPFLLQHLVPIPHICSIPIKGQESAASCLELLSMINKSCMALFEALQFDDFKL